jgi:hypothetical protein
VKEAAEGKLEPAFLGRAAEVVRQLQLGAMEWLEENRTTLIEVPFRIGLFGLGLAFVHALGVDGHLVTTLIAGLALKRAPKKSAQPGKAPQRAFFCSDSARDRLSHIRCRRVPVSSSPVSHRKPAMDVSP